MTAKAMLPFKSAKLTATTLAVLIQIFILFNASMIMAQDSLLPYPPKQFFDELAKKTIPKGDIGCCYNLRMMLTKSILISPYLAVKLFREGKIILGDARSWNEIERGYIFGAQLFPQDKVDFLKLKPHNIPIALY